MGRRSPRPRAAPSRRRSPVRRVLPSGLNATARTLPRCPARAIPRLAGGGVPQPRLPPGPSSLLPCVPVRTVLPSGLNATASTPSSMSEWLAGRLGRWRRPRAAPSCPDAPGEDRLAVGAERHGRDRGPMRRGAPKGSPVAASQSRAVLSSLPVRIVLPSGLNATRSTRVLMLQRARRWVGRWLASQSRAVLSPAGGEERFAVGAERDAMTSPDAAMRQPMGRPVARPRAGRAVVAAGEDGACRRG